MSKDTRKREGDRVATMGQHRVTVEEGFHSGRAYLAQKEKIK